MSDSSLSTLSWSPCTSPEDKTRILSSSEWVSTLEFLESDDCFFGTDHSPDDSVTRHGPGALGHFHTSTGSMDVSLTPLPLDAADSVRRSSLTSLNNDVHQPLPNSNGLSKIDQTIHITNVDYQHHLLPQAPVSAPAPGQAVSSASILQAHHQLLQAAVSTTKTQEESPPKKKRKPRVSLKHVVVLNQYIHTIFQTTH